MVDCIVCEVGSQLDGFYRKDIVLRVIAAGLNPENCTVVRVMTPNPDTATPETTVLDALKLMNGRVFFRFWSACNLIFFLLL